MKQLSGLDAGFLYMETPTTYGHISSLAVYERPTDDFRPYEEFRARVEARLGLLDPMRRRLAPVPLELDHPYWIEDPDFDLDFHIRHIGVPPPGSDSELAALVGRIIGRPLDRNKPLWEAYVIEGLPEGQWAVLTKVHHATIDGASGADFITMLLDLDPSVQPELVPPPAPDPLPSPAEMLFRTATRNMARPVRMARAQQRLLRDSFELLAKQESGWWKPQASISEVPTPSTAPATPFNKAISPHRRFAFASTSLGDLKAIKNATGATLNDVVMAVCAGALRRYLIKHDYPTTAPLIAGVPVSIRTGEEEERWTNRVSMIFGDLPVHLDHPLERVAAVHQSMVQAKDSFDAVPADALQDFTQFSPPAVFTAASRMATEFRMADRSAPTINLVISNVPGPREPLFMNGARMVHYYPVSTVAEGQGLNITVQSYQDVVDFGLVGCRDLVPDIWDLMDMIEEEIAALMAATADIRAATASTPAGGKKSAAKGATTEKAAARKPAPKKSATDKPAAKKPVAKKAAAKNAAAKKAATEPGSDKPASEAAAPDADTGAVPSARP